MHPTTVLVTVANVGTAVRLTTDTSINACKISVQQDPANTKRIIVGTAGLVGSSLTNTIAHVAAAGTAVTAVPSGWSIETQDSTNRLYPSDYWFDCGANGEKAIVTYWRA